MDICTNREIPTIASTNLVPRHRRFPIDVSPRTANRRIGKIRRENSFGKRKKSFGVDSRRLHPLFICTKLGSRSASTDKITARRKKRQVGSQPFQLWYTSKSRELYVSSVYKNQTDNEAVENCVNQGSTCKTRAKFLRKWIILEIAL